LKAPHEKALYSCKEAKCSFQYILHHAVAQTLKFQSGEAEIIQELEACMKEGRLSGECKGTLKYITHVFQISFSLLYKNPPKKVK
jgi:hypothetical protein